MQPKELEAVLPGLEVALLKLEVILPYEVILPGLVKREVILLEE